MTSSDLQTCIQGVFPEPRIAGHASHCATDSARKETLHDKNISNNANDAKKHDNSDKGGWSFLQALTNTSQSTKDEKVYVHPVMKRSSSMLNIKSLEMCTESIGSETGSTFDGTLYPYPIEECHSKDMSRPKKTYSVSKKLNCRNSFPPPLRTMSGSGGIRVKPHREGGRLILKAVTIPPYESCFHAERSMGRLKLHFLDDCVLDSNAHEQEEEIDFANKEGEIEGNGDNAEGEMELKKISRLSRSSCEEVGQRMQKWEPFWVVT